MPNTPEPTNQPTPISEWIKRAADTAEFVEKVMSSKKPPTNTPPTPTPTEEKPTGRLQPLLGLMLIIGSLAIIIFFLYYSFQQMGYQANHRTIVPEQYHYTNTPPTNATNFTEIQQCMQQQQSCIIPTDVLQNATNISIDGYHRKQHANNNNGLWISNGHDGHPEWVYILYPNATYMISQEFFPGKDITVYAHDNDIPLYHVDGKGGQNKGTDKEETTKITRGVIGGILFHAIL